MMDRMSLLKAAIKARLLTKKEWIFGAFSIMQNNLTESIKKPYPYKLARDPTGIYYYSDDVKQFVKITDANPSEPLYKFLEPITIDSDYFSNVASPIETYIGNVVFNAICIHPVFGAKLPFQTGRVSIGKVEGIIAANLESTPKEGEERNPSTYYVDELIKFQDSISFLNQLDDLATVGATEASITPPPGIEEYKKQLYESEFKNRLHDPVALEEFEKKLKQYAEENHLKGDAANGTSLAGKTKEIGYKKMFLTIGGEQDFSDSLEVTPVLNSLDQGWETSSKEFTALVNGGRVGSYSRGSETVNGGVAGKLNIRSIMNFSMESEDCLVTTGLPRIYNKSNIKLLVGHQMLENGKWLLIESLDQALKYVDKHITVRSPSYCLKVGDNLCKACCGKSLASNPKGLIAASMEISSIMLNTSMKAMHGKILSVYHYDYRNVFNKYPR